MRVARRYVIAGRVQGVGFRWFTYDAAAREGLHGWVRNLADGSVESVVEGAPEAVRAVVQWCRTGPPGARVMEVAEQVEPAGDAFASFEIRH